ncbi:MAG: DUF2339 domain-containing protein [Nonlabens sp.]
MEDQQDVINQLIEKLAILSKKQEAFKYEIFDLKTQLNQLQSSVQASNEQEKLEVEKPDIPETDAIINNAAADWEFSDQQQQQQQQQQPQQNSQPISNDNWDAVPSKKTVSYQKPIQQPKKKSPLQKSNLEKFIGENLLNKIGILITVIGVGIGAKYSIENDLISPLTRIILGYLSAIGLFGFGMKLKQKYESYSAVLVSGAIVILYFITFFAYSFYELIPQTVAFILMVMFTGFTIVASLNYNKQIIADLGVVGAYAVPFLLSNGSGQVEILFSYIAIINIGVLILAFKKYWKPLYYSSFAFTWLIFISWIVLDYQDQEHFTLALGFLLVFFIIFYLTFLSYKLVKKEVFAVSDIVLLLLNSFVFYGLGFVILGDNETGEHYLGLFTLCNAIIHFVVATVIYKQKKSDRKLFYLATALVLAFISIAIPVQLDGNWVTLLWTAQAVLLFWLGTSKKIEIYEKLSYPIMLLATLSLFQDWDNDYNVYDIETYSDIIPLFNISFMSSMLFVAALGFIVYLQRKETFVSALSKDGIFYKMAMYSIPSVLIFTLYCAFRLEIEFYFDQWYDTSRVQLPEGSSPYANDVYDSSIKDFKSIWIINYTLLFIGLLSYFNYKKIKNNILEKAGLIFTVLTVFIFLVQGLYEISDLREVYLSTSEYYNRGVFYLLIRYISFVFVAFAMLTLYRFVKKPGIAKGFKIVYDLILHISIVWVISSELIHWLDIAGATDAYKLGLSILWGVYSFLLIGFGILKNKPYLRIGGMGLFGITLIKLFFYDIAHLNTISKTIVFVSLGVLLLIISFLYNKYKNQINYNEKED